MLILYGIMRFIIEILRDDNPFEYSWWAIYKGGTVSQNISIYMIILGIVLMVIFQFVKDKQPLELKELSKKDAKKENAKPVSV